MSNQYKCGCGYGLSVKFNKNMVNCPNNKQAFRNHVTFPAIAAMPASMHENRHACSIYYDEDSHDVRHWAGLFQLDQKLNGNNQMIPNELWSTTNLYGEKFIAHIYTDHEMAGKEAPTTFSCSDFHVGKTLAILYADKCAKTNWTPDRIYINDMSYDTIYIFNAPIKQVQEEANRLLRNADLAAQSQMQECFECGVTLANLKSCGSCKLAKYCSKECQEKGWISGHKKLCRQANVLLRLACLPRHEFKGHVSFRENEEDNSYFELPLPQYKYSADNLTESKTKQSRALGSLDQNKLSDYVSSIMQQ